MSEWTVFLSFKNEEKNNLFMNVEHFSSFNLLPTTVMHSIEIGLEQAPFAVLVYFFPSFEHAKTC
jgi:hypothetical protein